MAQTQSTPLDKTLALAAAGDSAAWAQIVGLYTRRVFGLILKQCHDRELAEEITQDTFVKIVVKLSEAEGYREEGKFEPWLFRIAMNKLRDEMRRRKRQARPMDMSPAASAGASGSDQPSGWAAAESKIIQGAPSTPAGPYEAADHNDQVDRLRSAIKTLPQADQEILHLRHTAGLSFGQIAETLDQPLGTVLARGHRALGKLKKLLNPEDSCETPASKTIEKHAEAKTA